MKIRVDNPHIIVVFGGGWKLVYTAQTHGDTGRTHKTLHRLELLMQTLYFSLSDDMEKRFFFINV